MKNLIKKILQEEFNPEDLDWVDTEMTESTRFNLMNQALMEKGFKFEAESIGDIKSYIITDIDGQIVYMWLEKQDLRNKETRENLLEKLTKIMKELKGFDKRYKDDYKTIIKTLEIFI